MKRQDKRSKSQQSNIVPSSNEINITIVLSEEDQLTFSMPIDSPLEIVNMLLTEKIHELKNQQVVGFQSFPVDYLFDYRLSKNIGLLNESNNLTLNCLYKYSPLNNLSRNQKSISNLQIDLQNSTFLKLSKYKICKPLSSGGFSRVYLVRNLQNGQFYAAKFMEKCSQVNIDREDAIRNQFFVHKSLDHPYIVKMEEYIQTDQFYILIMEYCPGGELFTLLKNNRYMGEDKAKIIFVQILLALKYLHDRNIVFRDIKPENILIDGKGNAKLTDFGLAKEIRGKTNSYCGSVEYMAPEIVSKQTYSFDVDLYCMGALLYETLIGCPPFYNPNFSNNETKYHICNSEVCFPSKVPLSEEAKDLISSLLVKNPKQRLGHYQGVQQILQHDWMGQISIEDYLKGNIRNPFVPQLDVQNFDRQQDQYELSFRKKILKDMKNCKKIIQEINLMSKLKQKPQMKNKSHSIAISGQKHLKSKSQQDFRLTFSIKKQFEPFKMASSFNKWPSMKSNPYAVSIKNKSISQIIPIHKDEVNHLVDEKNSFKHKSMHRTLSRSVNKSTFSIGKYNLDPENTCKKQINGILLVNSKSCANSRKSSLYKPSNHKNNETTTSSNHSKSKSKTKFYESNNSKINVSAIAQNQFSKSKAKQQLQIKSKSSSKQKIRSSQKQELYIPKQIFEKQNFEGKGLIRKTALKKKFIFASSIKDGGQLKQNQLMFQRNINNDENFAQNRLTVV